MNQTFYENDGGWFLIKKTTTTIISVENVSQIKRWAKSK